MKRIYLLQGPGGIGKDYLIESLTGEEYGSYIHDNMANGGELLELGPRTLRNKIMDQLNNDKYLNKDCDFIFTMNTDLKFTNQQELRDAGYKIIRLKMEEI